LIIIEDSINVSPRKIRVRDVYKSEGKRVNFIPALNLFDQPRIEPSEPLASAFITSPIPAVRFDWPAIFTVGTADRNKLMLGIMLGIRLDLAHFISAIPRF